MPAATVYRAQVIGYYDDGRAASRLEVVLDATQQPARVLLWRDISHLGRGYALETLGVAAFGGNVKKGLRRTEFNFRGNRPSRGKRYPAKIEFCTSEPGLETA